MCSVRFTVQEGVNLKYWYLRARLPEDLTLPGRRHCCEQNPEAPFTPGAILGCGLPVQAASGDYDSDE